MVPPDQIILFTFICRPCFGSCCGGVFAMTLWPFSPLDGRALCLGSLRSKDAFAGFGHPATLVGGAAWLSYRPGLRGRGPVALLGITRTLASMASRSLGGHITLIGGDRRGGYRAFMNTSPQLAVAWMR